MQTPATKPGAGESSPLLARIALSAAVEPAVMRICAAVDRFGPVEVFARLVRGDVELDPRGTIQRRLVGVNASALHASGVAAGARYLTPEDADWPLELSGLSEIEHAGQGGSPFGLWVRGGAELSLLLRRRVAVVGSRAATSYGSAVASDLGVGLAERGLCVVSGAAYGIDAAAHRGALAANGAPTMAILACGIDLAYPQGNSGLIDKIAETGLLVSETPPGARVTRPRLLARNRLVAALGGSVVVVEAAWRSGALSTAGWAEDLGLMVMGVPGPVTSSLSSGVHRLLRQGALLVSDADDVLDAVGALSDDALPLTLGAARPWDDLPRDVSDVLEALPARRGVSVEELVIATGLATRAVLVSLAALDSRGLVHQRNGLWVANAPARLVNGAAP